MTAMTNAQRQRAYRHRQRNALTAGVVQLDPVTAAAEFSAQRSQWYERAIAGTLSPYQLHCCRIRYGYSWLVEMRNA